MHNTQWITGHFHLIFGGTVGILYFGIAYHLWPKMTGRQPRSGALMRSQIWLWFVGIVILTIPWHVLGLLGQPRRISSTPYDSPLVAEWIPNEIWMIVGGAILVLSSLMLVLNLLRGHAGTAEADRSVAYAEPIHPVLRLPKVLNGFALWNWILLIYMITSYGYPIAQFFLLDTYGTTPWGV